MATVCFSRVVGLSAMMQNRHPEQIVTMLNDIYHVLDCKIEKYDVFKIDSVGDSYVVASGISLLFSFLTIRLIFNYQEYSLHLTQSCVLFSFHLEGFSNFHD